MSKTLYKVANGNNSEVFQEGELDSGAVGTVHYATFVNTNLKYISFIINHCQMLAFGGNVHMHYCIR